MHTLARIFIVLRSVFFVLLGLSVALLSCSKDQPAPVAPAGKSLAPLAAPAAPTNLRFDAPTDSSCTVRWDASDGATDYDVNYKPAVGGRWTNEPHTGIRLYNTIHDLQPNTEYRWAVRAENSDGASEWIHGPNFTTLPSDIEGDDNVSTGGDTNQYIRIHRSYAPMADHWIVGDMLAEDALDELTYGQMEIYREAAAAWDRVIVNGLPEGIDIYPFISSNVDDWVYAYATTADTKVGTNGIEFIKSCIIGTTSFPFGDAITDELWGITEREFALRVAKHEIGHCLGIGGNNATFLEMTEEETIYPYEVIDDPTAPDGWDLEINTTAQDKYRAYFTGTNTVREFNRLADDKWGHTGVPLNYGESPSRPDYNHWDSPILMRSVMSVRPVSYGNLQYNGIHAIDVAALKDLGYSVNKAGIEAERLIVGFRYISTDEGYPYLGVETLMFPDHELHFPERAHYYLVIDEGRTIKKYMNAINAHAVPRTHPNIVWRNVLWTPGHLQKPSEVFWGGLSGPPAGKAVARPSFTCLTGMFDPTIP